MQASRLIPVTFLTVLLSFGVAQAEKLRDAEQPAEFPPSGYTGTQYVDSRGCVYVRAGFAGSVNWVPRVRRNKDLLCGFKPSLSASELAANAADTAAPVGAAVPVAPVVTPSIPALRTERPAAQVQTVRSVPRPAPVVEARPASSLPAVAPVRAPAIYTAPPAVRTASPVMAVNIAPALPAVKIAVPAGYRQAFRDGRLNAQRGGQTARGEAQMNQVWSQTVPRRLIESGAPAARVARLAQVPTLISSKSAPAISNSEPSVPATRSGGFRFVQVATFGDARNATNTVRRLQALGLPVSRSKVSRQGKTLQIVFAGPISARAELNQALVQVRAAGFSDAFFRR
jgi:sporulation related protein